MINVKEVAFIGFPVTDVPRARAFYENVLGLKHTMAKEIHSGVWWIEYEIAGVALAVTNAWPPSGQSGPTLALEVPDLPAALAELKNQNIGLTYGPMESPVCGFAGIVDPDGNSISLHQRKVS